MDSQAAGQGGAGRDLLLFSDVHLGADLKRRLLQAAGSLEALVRRDGVDRAVGGLLDHYLGHPPERGPWRLVLAGDVIDFIGINLTPRDLGETAPFEPSAEEDEYGLETGPERGAWLLGLVERRHPLFFERLGAFVAAGHELVLVRGNHDALLHWPEVQRAFVAALGRGAARAGAGGEEATLAGRVRFEDWFYLEPGRIFVEHGHLHDELCAEPLARLVEPGRPNRLRQPISTVLLRTFANRFPSLDLDHVDQWTARQFVVWAVVVENPFRIAAQFLRALLVLLRPFLLGALAMEEALPELAELVRTRRAGEEAVARGIGALVVRAARVTFGGVLRMLYLDRAMTVGGSLMLSASCVAMAAPWHVKGAVALGLVLLAALADRRMAAGREVAIAPKLLRAAAEVARLCQVPLVVMGHSHKAVDTPLPDPRSRYVNLGSWLGAHRPTPDSAGFVHLIVRGQEAELRRWPAPASRG